MILDFNDAREEVVVSDWRDYFPIEKRYARAHGILRTELFSILDCVDGVLEEEECRNWKLSIILEGLRRCISLMVTLTFWITRSRMKLGLLIFCGVGNWFTVRVDWVDDFLGC